ncbi:putative motility protein [Otoolea muris]|uniref:putative motility protein n=1 Tax=Otoolea muris TaxID=2941515 RepID=UPI00203E2B1E|nr:YjfB family protein [Otoolea muris]
MDVMSIASLGMAMSTSRMMVDVNMALMAKTQDLAEIQGQEIQNMIEAAPSFHALDVYA